MGRQSSFDHPGSRNLTEATRLHGPFLYSLNYLFCTYPFCCFFSSQSCPTSEHPVQTIYNRTSPTSAFPRKKGSPSSGACGPRMILFPALTSVSMGTMFTWSSQRPRVRSGRTALLTRHPRRVSGRSICSHPLKTWLPGLLRNQGKEVACPLTGACPTLPPRTP